MSNNQVQEELRLRQEFSQLDLDGDGRVDKMEMDTFLKRQGIDDEHRQQIVEELFNKLDNDANGRIDLEEFSAQYVSTKNQLVEREQEIKVGILTNNQKLRQAREMLAQAKRKHGNFIQGPMGELHVTVIRAENLMGVHNSHVMCYQGNKHGQTRPAKGTSPNYDNAMIQFEVDDDRTPLVVQILDIDRGEPVLETQISFDDIKEDKFPTEFWLNTRENDPMAAKLRLKINYVQNEVLKWDAEANMLVTEIKNDAQVLQQVRIFIDQLRTPFGFLSREINAMQSELRRQSIEEEKEDGKPDHQYYQEEQKAAAAFDAYVDKVAAQYKIETIPWLTVSKVCVWIFLPLVMLQMLKRNCVLSLTVAMLALYVLEYPNAVSRQTFRGLVLLIALSWVYDFLQIFFIDASASDEDEEDGGNEWKLRRFVRLLTYIALVFKVILVLVFWKDSRDFRSIVLNKKKNENDELEDILAAYGGQMDNSF